MLTTSDVRVSNVFWVDAASVGAQGDQWGEAMSLWAVELEDSGRRLARGNGALAQKLTAVIAAAADTDAAAAAEQAALEDGLAALQVEHQQLWSAALVIVRELLQQRKVGTSIPLPDPDLRYSNRRANRGPILHAQIT